MPPRLVITSPGTLAGSVLALGAEDLVLGRSSRADLRVDDPHISRIHARFGRHGDQVLVRDMGSTGGTTVNGAPALGPVPLHHGDVVSFANVQARFEGPGRELTEVLPAVGGAGPLSPSASSFDVSMQQAQQLNNVGHDQHVQYIQQMQESRTRFFEELATLKTKARRLITIGFIIGIAGFSTYAAVLLRFISSVDTAVSNNSDQMPTAHLLGPSVGGVPIGAIGFAAAVLGGLLVVVGVIFHVLATLRRRRFEQTSSSPWPPSPWLS